MDPISLAISAVGLGMSIFGGMSQSKTAGEEAKVSQDEARQEQGINNQKQMQMELEGRRAQMENIRNIQRARAMGINSATNQGAQFGSGLQGGLADITDQGLFNMQGVEQGLAIGRNINAYNQNITQDKIQMASLKGQEATNAAWSSVGGALIKAGPIVGAFAKGFGGSGPIGTFSNGGNDGAAPTWG